jgi:SAM-dependent methyltransferase
MSIYPDPQTPAERVRALVRDRVWQNSSRIYLDAFAREAAESVARNALVLDAGAGVAPYRRYFGHAKYETADFLQVEKDYEPMDYVCSLDDIPVEDERFDLVLLTQVLEHVPEPQAVLQELCRVLRPGGTLWLSAPLFYAEHEEPYDFYRYTQFGFRHQLEGAGFEVLEIAWLEGYCGTVSYQLKEASMHLPPRPADYGGGALGTACAAVVNLLRPVLFGLSVLLSRSDTRHRYTGGGQCKNYRVVATKPKDGTDVP